MYARSRDSSVRAASSSHHETRPSSSRASGVSPRMIDATNLSRASSNAPRRIASRAASSSGSACGVSGCSWVRGRVGMSLQYGATPCPAMSHAPLPARLFVTAPGPCLRLFLHGVRAIERQEHSPEHRAAERSIALLESRRAAPLQLVRDALERRQHRLHWLAPGARGPHERRDALLQLLHVVARDELPHRLEHAAPVVFPLDHLDRLREMENRAFIDGTGTRDAPSTAPPCRATVHALRRSDC